MDILRGEHIMATQTRRTTRRSARFFRATVKASMVTACCGLILMSAVAAHAAAPFNGMPRNGLPLQGMPMQGMPTNGIPVNGTPLQGLPASEGSLPSVQSESLPWSTLSQRPLGQSTP
jgi:hypothetical protein